MNYEFRVLELRVIDGDTVDVRLDCGFSLSYKTKVRLLGVNAPEKAGREKQAGLLVANAVQTLLTGHLNVPECEIICLSGQWDMYGRILGDFELRKPGGFVMCLTDYLIKQGYSKRPTASGKRIPFTAAELSTIIAKFNQG